MSNHTTYTVFLNGTEVETRSRKESAIQIADSKAAENPFATLTVVTSAGTEVHRVEPPVSKGKNFKPWTRTETPKFEAPEIAGFTPAYVRNRIGAVVYRANDRSGWLVVETKTGKQHNAVNTAEAREITNKLAADRRAAKEAEAKEAKEAKEAAKADAA